MKRYLGKVSVMVSIAALAVLLLVGTAFAYAGEPVDGTTDGNGIAQMIQWMGPENWGQMIQQMTQIHGAEWTAQMVQQMNEGDHDCIGDGGGGMMGNGFGSMMGQGTGNYNGFGFGGMMGGR